MSKISGLWVGIIIIVLGLLVVFLPDLIRWVAGIAIIVIGIQTIIRR